METLLIVPYYATSQYRRRCRDNARRNPPSKPLRDTRLKHIKALVYIDFGTSLDMQEVINACVKIGVGVESREIGREPKRRGKA